MKKTLLSILCLLGLFSASFAYSTEEIQAYNYAYQNGITTMTSIGNADMGGNLTRIAMAKMLSNYAINILGLTPDTTKDCNFSDVSSNLDYQYDNGVTKACQLGLMGVGINQFYPNGKVTRAEFDTVLSRALNAKDISKLNQMNNANPYYSEHLNYLNEQGIMNNISNPGSFELRGRVMLMLMRSDKNYTGSEIASFDELNDVVATCHVDDMGGYDYNVTKMAYILPYKDGYIGFDFDAQDGWNLYLTYRTLENPCDVLSTTDTIFWWNPAYKIGDATFRGASYPDNKIFYDQGLKSGIPTQIVAKELNCEPGKYGDGTFDTACTQEAMKYFYDLLIGAENDEYFTQWLKKFKEDIDNGNFRLRNYWIERHDSCLERVKAEIGDVKAGDSEEVRGNYIKLKTEKLHECAIEYLK